VSRAAGGRVVVAVGGLVAGFVWAPSLEAQAPVDPQAYDILHQAMDRYYQRLEGVENYTIVQDLNGVETTLYLERRERDGTSVFVVIPPQDWQDEASPGTGGGAPAGLPGLPGLPGSLGTSGVSDPRQALMKKGMDAALGGLMGGGSSEEIVGNDPRLFEQLAPRARLVGTETVDGVECHVLKLDDLSDLDLSSAGGGDGDFTLTSMTVWLDKTDLVGRKTVVEGETKLEGDSYPIRIESTMSDYRSTAGMFEPWSRVTRMPNLMDVMREADPKKAKEMEKALEQASHMDEQMAEARKELARLPAAQRRMFESQMGSRLSKLGPQMQQMKQLLAGGAMEMVTRITDLRVNEGPPKAATGRWAAQIGASAGGAIPDLEGQAAGMERTSMDAESPWTITLTRPVADGVLPSSVIQMKLASGFESGAETRGFGAITLMLADGRQGTFQTDPQGAVITIEAKTDSKVRGRYRFTAPGAWTDGARSTRARITVSGTFVALLAPGLTP